MNLKSLLLICLSITAHLTKAQQGAALCFEITEESVKLIESLISINLDKDIFQNIDENIALVKVSKEGEQFIPFQLDSDKSKIWFKHNGMEKTVSYCLKKETNLVNKTNFNIEKKDGDLNLKYRDESLISYRHEMKAPPEGIDEIYQKSGFIHPVLSPKGDTLSRIQPPDHYHHYGVWGPWTRTKINQEGVDFWNLKYGQWTVLFKEFDKVSSGQVFAGFIAKQEHLYSIKKDPKVAINESLEVKVWKNSNPNRYFIDYTSRFSSPVEKGILFEAYRYGGGLGFRFKEQWHKDNCYVLTSEGKNRITADGTSVRWCIVYGESTDKKGMNGILFMSHPNNRSHPEPMRVWPITANNDRGDMFFEFCPIRNKEWIIEHKKTYSLNYRMLVFEGTLSPEEAEANWKAFAYPPQILKINN